MSRRVSNDSTAVKDAGRPLHSHGLESLDLARHLMARPHRHNDIELNFIESGSVTYLLGGAPVTFETDRLYAFWSAMPHQIVQVEPETRHRVLTVPLHEFLRFQLPESFVRRLLHGHPVMDPEPDNVTLNRLQFQRWHRLLATDNPLHSRITLLEVEACLGRLALLQGEVGPHPRQNTSGSLRHVEQMVAFIARAYREPLAIQEIAATAGLHPHYAMQLFRRHLHMTILDYLTQYRVAHAQRLLVTTDLPVLEIALACGFNSLSRFYAAFKRICGRSPRAYRREHDALQEGRLVALLNSLDERRRPGEPGRS